MLKILSTNLRVTTASSKVPVPIRGSALVSPDKTNKAPVLSRLILSKALLRAIICFSLSVLTPGLAKRILDKKLDLFLKVVFPKNNKKRRISGWKIITIIITPTLMN